MPNLYIIAGPNGAGKTTSAMVLLPEVFGANYFINADEIARLINPLHPEKAALQAGKLMLSQIDEMIENKKDFAFETTLSARNYRNLIKNAAQKGYLIHLVFIYLNNPKLAQKRVKTRVMEGDIPEDVIIRRYKAGLVNLIKLYIPIIDHWVVYNNSGTELTKIAHGEKIGEKVITEITNTKIWKKIMEMQNDA